MLFGSITSFQRPSNPQSLFDASQRSIKTGSVKEPARLERRIA
jgi:hypothetical protein